MYRKFSTFLLYVSHCTTHIDYLRKKCSITKQDIKLERTYQEWLEQAEEKVNELRKDGLNVVKLDIDMEELRKWYAKSDKPVDGYTRSEYAAYLAQNNKNFLR